MTCLLLAVLLLMLASCARTGGQGGETHVPTETTEAGDPTHSADSTDATEDVTSSLTLDGRRYTFVGNADDIRVEDAEFIFRQSGIFRVSGTLTEGSLVVDADETAVVHLILDGLSVTSGKKAPICVLRAAAVIIECAEGSVNLLEDVSSAHVSHDAYQTSVLFADGNLRLCGSGSLVLSGKRQYGLTCTGRAVMDGASLTVSAPEDALLIGQDFSCRAGRICVTEATNGIRVAASKTDTASPSHGTLAVTGGEIVVRCRETALVSTHAITVTGGKGSLYCENAFVCRRTEEGKEIAGTVTVAQNWQKNE